MVVAVALTAAVMTAVFTVGGAISADAGKDRIGVGELMVWSGVVLRFMMGVSRFSPKAPLGACRLLEGLFTQLEARTSRLLTLLDVEEEGLEQMEARVERSPPSSAR